MNTSFKCKLCTETDQDKFRSKIVRGKTYYEKCCKSCEAMKSREYYHSHKVERALYQKEYLLKNKDSVKVKKKKYDSERYSVNVNKILVKVKDYRLNNKTKINAAKRNRRKNDPAYRLRYYISNRIRKILKQSNCKKNTSCLKYLNYTFLELKNHIEKQFESWMTWDNHGLYNLNVWKDDDICTWRWSLDHIIPQSNLPYTSMMDDNFKKCWALENLRPLSAKQNYLDGIKRVRHDK